ncbi:HD-GYP domain-containing protein [Litoribrevibacter euphylliae]|uniref:HD-GYP domain-containing protein n=1 Tax=Litoribrevibacter euphylliae TaxID=1834034 RepID=A0ABV7HGV4_9GAMM
MTTTANDQYLGHVTDLGETDVVTASEDIVSAKGVLLLPKGATINKNLLARLQQHSINKEVDQVISIQDTLDASSLMEFWQEYLKENPQYKASLDLLHDRDMPIRGFARLRLNTSMRNKVTVCKKQKPDLFEHSMLVTYTALCVADMMQIPRMEADDLATAAIFHDLGMLHLSEELEDRGNIFTPEQERHIASHPIIMHRILDQFPEYQDSIAKIVLEHHERLDGSGYPMAKSEYYLSIPSQILATVECGVSIYHRHGYHYTVTVLKTHMGEQLNDEASKCLIKILESWAKASSDFDLPRDANDVKKVYDKLITAVTSGEKVMEQVTNPFLSTNAAQHLKRRLLSIDLAMSNAGLDKFRGSSTMEMATEDDDLIMEVGALVQDGIFQVIDSIRIFRRQLHPDSKIPPELNQWLKSTEEALKDYFLGDGL